MELERLTSAEHEDVALVQRRRSGLRAIIAVHSTALGPALGGVRFYPYANLDVAIHDVLRLSRSMTSKAALAGLDQGGGKAVIIGDPASDKSDALLDDFAAAVDSFAGRYITAEDVGTTQDDMDRIRLRTPHVGGTATAQGGSGDPSAFTAVGVVSAMEAAAAHRWGTDLRGRSVLVVGAGKTGGELIRLLVEREAQVIVSEPDPDRRRAALQAGAASSVDPTDVLRTPADILAPCALGGLLTEEVAPTVAFQIIVGAANNQLSSPAVAPLLDAAGALYIPDYLANAGGIINIAEEAGGYDPARARAAVERVGATTTELLRRADEQHVTPAEAADAMVADRLRQAG